MLFFLLLFSIFHATQTTEPSVVLTYDQSHTLYETEYKKLVHILEDALKCMPTVLCKLMVNFLNIEPVHTGYIKDPDLFPDGYLSVVYTSSHTIAAGTSGSNIELWDTQTTTRIKKLRGHSNSVPALEYDSDNKRLISGSYDSTLIIWDIEARKHQTIKTRKKWWDWDSGFVTRIAFLDNNIIAFGGLSDPISLVDLRSNLRYKVFRNYQSAYGKNAQSIIKVNSNTFAAICSYKRTLALLDHRSETPIQEWSTYNSGSFNDVVAIGENTLALAFNNIVKLVDINKPETFDKENNMRYETTIEKLTRYKDKYLLTASNDYKMQLWDPQKSLCIRTMNLPITAGWINIPLSLAANQEGTSIAAAVTGSPGSLYMWKTAL